MTRHACSRCGHESRSRSSWADRHPAAAVTAGLFTLTLMSMMLAEHPVAALAVLAIAGVGAVVWLVDRQRDRRAATAARADYEYRAVIAAPMPLLPAPARIPAAWSYKPTPLERIALLRTEPLRTSRD